MLIMKKLLISILLLVLVSAFVQAQIYEVHYTLEHGLDIADITVGPTRIGDPQTGDDLIIQQFDQENNLLHEQGFTIIERFAQEEGDDFFDFVLHAFNAVVSVQVPYISNATTMRISFEEQEEVITIGDFTCNRNGVCDFGENHNTCPTDCPVESDGICNPRIDGICDPDCGLRDPDCTEEDLQPRTLPADIEQTPTRTERELQEYFDSRPEPREINTILVGFILLLLLALIVFVIMRLKRSSDE